MDTFVSFEIAYRKKILPEYIAALKKIMKQAPSRSIIEKKLLDLAKQYNIDYQNLLSESFIDVESKLYTAYVEELEKQLKPFFKYEKKMYKFGTDAQGLTLFEKTTKSWLNLRELNYQNTKWIWSYYEKDGINLSQRIWKHAAATSRDVQEIILRSMQTGMSSRQVANQIIKTQPQQEIVIPKWLQTELEDISSPDQALKMVQNYIKKTMRYNATRIARTEINKAYRGSYKNMVQQFDFVKAVKWNLSETHPFIGCACEHYATQNEYGLGEGVFPKDECPISSHPHCKCYLTTVLGDVEEFLDDI